MKPLKISKQARKMVTAIETAGGAILRMTGNGHLIVKGPKGIATIGAHDLGNARSQANTVAGLSRYCGLDVKL